MPVSSLRSLLAQIFWRFDILLKEINMMLRKALVSAAITALLVAGQGLAGDWTHWRGPFFDGSTDEENLPSSFGKTENLAWVSPLPGPGAATPIVANGRVFISSTDSDGPELVGLCFDAGSGRQLWRKTLGASEAKAPNNNMAAPSPVADDNSVYFLFGSGHLAGLDHQGNILWSRNIQQEYGNISIKYGYSSSPLLYGGRLYVLVQRRHTAYRAPQNDSPLDSFLLAIDAKTGRNVWKQPRRTDAVDESFDAYTSPILFQTPSRMEILTIGGDYVIANHPETGKESWRYGYNPRKNDRWRLIPSVVTGDGLIFGVQPRGTNELFALRSGGNGTLSDQDNVAWRYDGPTPDCSTPLLYKGNLYVVDGMRHGKVVTCLDPKTGRQKWQGQIGGRHPWRASLTAGDDKLYCMNEAAEVIVLAAGEEQFRVIFRIDLNEGPSRSSIAIANGRLFIRTAKNLYCVGREDAAKGN
jgi:outer membrane protein assembly factor BamB